MTAGNAGHIIPVAHERTYLAERATVLTMTCV